MTPTEADRDIIAHLVDGYKINHPTVIWSMVTSLSLLALDQNPPLKRVNLTLAKRLLPKTDVESYKNKLGEITIYCNKVLTSVLHG